mgnify:CR=1 FL=1
MHYAGYLSAAVGIAVGSNYSKRAGASDEQNYSIATGEKS